MAETQTLTENDVETVTEPEHKPTPREVLEANSLWPNFTKAAERYLHRLDVVLEPVMDEEYEQIGSFYVPSHVVVHYHRDSRCVVADIVNIASRYAMAPEDLQKLLSGVEEQ